MSALRTRLDELGVLYGADKSSLKHNYLDAYDSAIAPISLRVKIVLEIGVFRGASLKMWRDYFPDAQIVGVDIEPKAVRFTEPRVAIEIGRQEDPVFLRGLIEKYGAPDVIVDDGSHLWAHQIATFRELYPALAPGGVYIVEDLHTSQDVHAEKYGVGSAKTAARFFSELAMSMSLGGTTGDGDEDAFGAFVRDTAAEIRFGPRYCIVTKT